MAEPSQTGGNPGNYFIGKGIVEFKPAGSNDWIDMGNVPEFEFTPEIETLEHFSSREGVQTLDAEVVLRRGGTLRILCEEMTPTVMAIGLLGTLDEAAVGGPEIEIFSANSVQGEVRFTATNDVGPRWNRHYFNVSFIPSGSDNAISEEWGQMELSGNVLVAPGNHPTNPGQVGIAKLTNLPSVS